VLIITIGAARGATLAQATRILKKIRSTGRLPEYPKSADEESAAAGAPGA